MLQRAGLHRISVETADELATPKMCSWVHWPSEAFFMHGTICMLTSQRTFRTWAPIETEWTTGALKLTCPLRCVLDTLKILKAFFFFATWGLFCCQWFLYMYIDSIPSAAQRQQNLLISFATHSCAMCHDIKRPDCGHCHRFWRSLAPWAALHW